MANKSQHNLQQKLAQIYGTVNQGEPQYALAALKPLLRKWPQNADVLHLAALSYKALGDTDNAVVYFNRTLAVNRRQPEAHNNLANLHNSNNRYEEAEKHYRAALSLNANYQDALRNLALCLSAQSKFVSAIEIFERMHKLKPGDARTLSAEADCYRKLGQYDIAQNKYQQAVSITPGYANAWYGLGVNYFLLGSVEDALQSYQSANTLAPNKAEIVESYALLLKQQGSLTVALELLGDCLVVNPANIRLHEVLNEMLWESNQAEQFGDSYISAIDQCPELPEIRESYIAHLFRAGQLDRAEFEADKAMEYFSDSPALKSLKGQIFAERGKYFDALSLLDQALVGNFSNDIAQQATKIHIIIEQYNQAQKLLDELLRRNPECQLSWGLQGLVWRLQGDERHLWLNDYQHLVKAYQLAVPERYASMDEYLRALSIVLTSKHNAERAPLQQTLRNGTQTSAGLFFSEADELLALKNDLQRIVSEYIRGLPDDHTHPMLRRKSDEFEFSGSWSVMLRPNGFHINHVHSAGWISSSCYISIPQTMIDDDSSLEGAIKFGESPLKLGEREQVAMNIKPRAGMVVLFPSYMWHGTYPFKGKESEVRLTAPFDVIPKSAAL